VLTQNQIDHYDAFGFLKLPNLFSTSEIDELRIASLSVMRELRGTDDYTTAANQSVQPWCERHPAMQYLIDDERIHQIPESLLGEDFWLDGTEGHLRVGDTAWHGDTDVTGVLGWVKVAIYLDPLAREDGCLRVIPGSHRWNQPDLLAPLRVSDTSLDSQRFGLQPTEIPSVALETRPGDVLVFTERIIHGAFGGGVGRHQICASFVEAIKTEEQERKVMEFYKSSNYSMRPVRRNVESDRPRIRRMVQTPLSLGFEVFDI